jgi:hypothetical protein
LSRLARSSPRRQAYLPPGVQRSFGSQVASMAKTWLRCWWSMPVVETVRHALDLLDFEHIRLLARATPNASQ